MARTSCETAEFALRDRVSGRAPDSTRDVAAADVPPDALPWGVYGAVGRDGNKFWSLDEVPKPHMRRGHTSPRLPCMTALVQQLAGDADAGTAARTAAAAGPHTPLW